MGTLEKRTTQDGRETFRAKIRLRGFPSQTASFKRKTDARKWIQATESSIREGRYFHKAESKRHTLAELIDRYVTTFLPTKPKSQVKQTQQLTWWKKRIGAFKLADITPALIAECRDELSNTETCRIDQKTMRRKKYTPATVNRYLAALSHAFTIAIKEWAWAHDNPVKNIRKLKEPSGRVRFLSDDEREALLAACKTSKNQSLYLVVVLSLSTGGREQEIWGLTWKQVDLKRGVITLTETKTGERRGLPLKGLALELMKKHNKIRALHSIFVFPGVQPNTSMDFRTAWETALNKAQIDNFTYHDLRHSTASYLAMNGATLAEIADVLGHKTLQMVKRYTHLAPDHTAKVVASMNEKIFGL
jgi:integrase